MRRLPRGAAVEDAGIILDAVAVTHLLEHLQVVEGAHGQAVGFQLLALALQHLDLGVHLPPDLHERVVDALLGDDVMGGGVDVYLLELLDDLAGELLHPEDALDLVAEELHPDDGVLVGGVHLDGVAAHAELTPGEVKIPTGILDINQAPDDGFQAGLLPHLQPDHPLEIFLRRAQAVDARNAGHDDDIVARQQRAGGCVPQPVDLVVDGAVLLDVGIRGGQVCLRLVIVVVADEILDGVVGHELLELVAQLRGQRLVVGHHQRRPAVLGDHVGHGESLARAGHPQQGLAAVALLEAGHQRVDRLGLIAGRAIHFFQLEGCHELIFRVRRRCRGRHRKPGGIFHWSR